MISEEDGAVVNFGQVAIGVRCGARPDPYFADSLCKLLIGGTRPGDQYLKPAIGISHSCAANALVERFLEGPAQSLLFLDDDMVFEPDALERLRCTPGDADILAGLACCRRGQMLPVAFVGGSVVRQFDRPLHYLDVVGLAFTLITRACIYAVREQRQQGAGVFRWDNEAGEDGEFCGAAANAGYRAAINPEVVIGHRFSGTVRWEEARQASAITIDNVDHAKVKPA